MSANASLESPYKPLDLPDSMVAAPAPPPIDTAPPPASGGPLQPGSHLGGAALIGDSILRGYMQGRAAADQKKAVAMKRMGDGLKFSYDTSAQKYYEMAKSGADPKSKEMQDARAEVEASWASMMKFYDHQLNGDDKKPKAKGKKSSDPQQAENPMTGLTSQDPHEKARAILGLMVKGEAPVFHQAAQFETPEYQASLKTKATTAATGVTNATHDATIADLQKQRDTILAKPEAQRTPEEKSQLSEMEARLEQEGVIKPTPVAKKITDYIGADGKKHVIMQNADGTQEDKVSEGEVRKSASEGKHKEAWVKKNGKLYSVEMDANNHEIPGTENYDKVPPAGMVPHVREGEFTWRDADGGIHRSKSTTTTAPVYGGGGSPSAAPHAGTTHPSASGHTSSSPASSTHSPAGHEPAAAATGDRVVGYAGTPEERKARQQADDLEKTYAMSKEFVKNPTPTNAQALVYAYAKSQIAGAGRLTQTEFLNASKSGSYGMRWKNWAETALTGHATPEFMKMMASTIGIEARAARQVADKYKHAHDGKTPPATTTTHPQDDIEKQIMEGISKLPKAH